MSWSSFQQSEEICERIKTRLLGFTYSFGMCSSSLEVRLVGWADKDCPGDRFFFVRVLSNFLFVLTNKHTYPGLHRVELPASSRW